MKNRLLVAILLFVQPFLLTGRPAILDHIHHPAGDQSYPAIPEAPTINPISHIGGPVHTVQVQGHYVYAGFGQELAVLDITHPSQPKIASSILALGEIQDLYIDGNYLYLAFLSNINNTSGVFFKAGLQIIDIHNPAVPVQLGSVETSTCTFNAHIAAKGGLAFLGANECQAFGGIIQSTGASLYPIDVSTPMTPKVLDTFIYHEEMPFSTYGIAASGDFAYVTSYENSGGKLKVFNISPLSVDFMHQVGSVDAANPNAIAIGDDYAFLTSEKLTPDTAGIQVVDIQSPESPQVVTSYVLPGSPQGISISGGYAFVAAGRAGLRIVDISNPVTPLEVGFCDSLGSAAGVSVEGRYASVADGWGGVRIIDIFDPANPFQIGKVEIPQTINDIGATGSYAYLAANDGLWVMDVSHPTAPALINRFITTPTVALLLAGDIAYLADAENGLRVVNIANPSALFEVGFVKLSGYLLSLSQAGNKLVAATKDAGLYILDVSTPTTPVEIGHLETTYGINDVEVSGNYAYLATTEGDLRIIDISHPVTPVEVGSYNLPPIYPGSQATSLAIAGKTVYITTVASGPTPLAGCCYGKVWVMDVSKPDSPKQVGASSTMNAPYRVTFSNGLLFVANGKSGLSILDPSNPAAPVEVAFYNTSEPIYGVSLSGDLIYIYNQSIYLLNYADKNALPGVNGRVTEWNHDPYLGASVSGGDWLNTATDSQGKYQFTGLVSGSYIITSATPGFVFFPASRSLVVPPGASDQDFIILPAPVSTILRPSLAATLTYTDTQGLPTLFEFPAGAVDLFSTLVITPTLASADPGFAFTGHAFILDAFMNSVPTGVSLSDFTFNAPIQVAIQYSADDNWVISDLDALTLWWRTTDGWQDAAQTCDPPSVYTRDPQNRTITIAICKTGTFALFGNTHTSFLPIIR
jgi:hypothetical protein